jgi:HK97 gp10 family phage protein
MADGLDIQVVGLSELLEKLQDLGDKQAKAAMRKALRAGAQVEQAAIIERAPVKVGEGGILPEGALKNDIVIKFHTDDDGSMTAAVGPDKLTARVATWVEYGHRRVTGGYSRLDKKTGKTRGPGKAAEDDVPEHPFIRPAWESTEQEVTDTICSTLVSEIEKAAARKGKS